MSCMSPYSMPLCTVLTKCPRAVGACPGTAGGTVVESGSDSLQQRQHLAGHRFVAARHDRGAVQGSLFATRDAASYQVDTLLAQRLLPTSGVAIVGVAAVDDDVAPRQQREQGGEGSRRPVRRPESSTEFCAASRATPPARPANRWGKTVSPRPGWPESGSTTCGVWGVQPVVERHPVAFRLEVDGQVLAHDGQSHETYIRFFHI